MKMTMFRGFQTPSPPNYPMDRKIKKPLMEKHRRERMNKSLSHLKDKLIKHYPSETSKLEKADILEKTVFHVDRMEKMLDMIQQSFNANMRQMEVRFFEFLAIPSNGLSTEQLSHLKQQYQMFVKRPVQPPFSMNFPVVPPNIFKGLPPMFMPIPLPIIQNMHVMANKPATQDAGHVNISTTNISNETPIKSAAILESSPCSSQVLYKDEGETEEIDVVENDSEWYSKRSDDSGISSSPEVSKGHKIRSEDVWRPF